MPATLGSRSKATNAYGLGAPVTNAGVWPPLVGRPEPTLYTPVVPLPVEM